MKVTTQRRATRCAFCHDELGAEFWSCDRCGVALHTECREEDCPTLGCEDAFAAEALAALPAEPHFARRAERRSSGAWLVVLLVGACLLTLCAGPYLAFAVLVPAYLLLVGPLVAYGSSETLGRGLLAALVAFFLEALVGAALAALVYLAGEAAKPLLVAVCVAAPPGLGVLAAALVREERAE